MLLSLVKPFLKNFICNAASRLIRHASFALIDGLFLKEALYLISSAVSRGQPRVYIATR